MYHFEAFIIFVLAAFFSLVTGRWFWYKPPKKINWLYGYRTKRSMKNLQRWKFAHRYSGKLFLRFGMVLLLLAMLSFYFEEFVHIPGVIAVLIFILGTSVIIFLTERAIKKKFDN